MIQVYDFKEQLEKQEPCCDQFALWVRARSNVLGTCSATMDEDLRGIDLWAITSGREGGTLAIQVKTDFLIQKTGNMAAEVVGSASYRGKWRPGWLAHLHNIDLLAYICGNTGDFALYSPERLWAHVMANYTSYETFKAENGSADGSEWWYGLGVKVPVSSLKHLVLDRGNIYHLDTGEETLVYE